MSRARFGKVEPITGDIGNQQAVEKIVSIMNNRNNELFNKKLFCNICLFGFMFTTNKSINCRYYK